MIFYNILKICKFLIIFLVTNKLMKPEFKNEKLTKFFKLFLLFFH